MGESLSFYLSDDNADYLSDHPNRSELVDRLITEYRQGGQAENVILDYRIQQVSQEVAMSESMLETQRERLAELKDRKDRLRQQERATVRQFVDENPETGHPPAKPENAAIQNWAREADMDAGDFAQAVRDEREARGAAQ